MMHPIDEIKIIWVPLQVEPGGLHICKIYGDVPPKWTDFAQKSLNIGPILTLPKKF